LTLTEIAPGIDPENYVLAHMDFKPEVRSPLKTMEERIFYDRPMGLLGDIKKKTGE